MKKEELEKLEGEIEASWEPVESAVQKEWKYLLEMIDKMLGKKGKFYFDSEFDDVIPPVFVGYDGGRHPEYASNMYSQVNGVFRKDGKLFVDIEDTDEYPIERLNIFDVYDIATAMCEELIELKNMD